MASKQTEHYKLNQWELTDDVRMEDFNADNAKIDAALGALTGAYSPENKPYVVGGYTGNNAATRVISLGFTPSAVLVLSGGTMSIYSGVRYGGLALPGRCAGSAISATWVSGKTSLAIVDGGFQVGFTDGKICSNASDLQYNYIAFR